MRRLSATYKLQICSQIKQVTNCSAGQSSPVLVSLLLVLVDSTKRHKLWRTAHHSAHQLRVTMGCPQVIRYLTLFSKPLLATSLRADKVPFPHVNKPHMELHGRLSPEVLLATNIRAGKGSLLPVNKHHMALHVWLSPEVFLATNIRAGDGSLPPVDNAHMAGHVWLFPKSLHTISLWTGVEYLGLIILQTGYDIFLGTCRRLGRHRYRQSDVIFTIKVRVLRIVFVTVSCLVTVTSKLLPVSPVPPGVPPWIAWWFITFKNFISRHQDYLHLLISSVFSFQMNRKCFNYIIVLNQNIENSCWDILFVENIRNIYLQILLLEITFRERLLQEEGLRDDSYS